MASMTPRSLPDPGRTSTVRGGGEPGSVSIPAIVLSVPISVARVRAELGPAGGPAAFNLLESRLPTLRGRRMYGVYYPTRGDYYACVKLDADHPDDMGFERGTIPGGRYARRKVRDWLGREAQIAGWFDDLILECRASGFEIDSTRPSVEFYRSLSELVLLVPVMGARPSPDARRDGVREST